jgi:hypothetical protein
VTGGGFDSPLAHAPHWVYELLDASGKHVYIGSTSNIGNRLKQHAGKHWWSTVAEIRTTLHSDLRTSLAVERSLIETHQPPNNGTFTDKCASNAWPRKRAEDAAAHEAGLLCNRTYCRQGCNQRAHDEGYRCARPTDSWAWNDPIDAQAGRGCDYCIDYIPAEFYGDMVETTCWRELSKRLGGGRKATYLCHSTPNSSAMEALEMHEHGADVEQMLAADRERLSRWASA